MSTMRGRLPELRRRVQFGRRRTKQTRLDTDYAATVVEAVLRPQRRFGAPLKSHGEHADALSKHRLGHRTSGALLLHIDAADEAHMLSVIGEASRRALIDSIVPRKTIKADSNSVFFCDVTEERSLPFAIALPLVAKFKVKNKL